MSNCSFQGIYQIIKRKAPATGEPSDKDIILYEGPEFSNLIVDTGLDRIAEDVQYPAFLVCHVGTGNTAPAVTQTGLVSYLMMPSAPTQRATATAVDVASGTDISDSIKPFWWRKLVYIFAPGQIAGNVSELGLFKNGDQYMWSRELVRDFNGNPTSITVLVDEYLEVRYEVRVYPNMTPDVRTVSILGVDTTVTTIPWMVDVFITSGSSIVAGLLMGVYNPFDNRNQSTNDGADAIFSTSASSLGTPFTATPARVGSPPNYQERGSSPQVINVVNSPYTSGSRTRDIVYSVPPSKGNLVGGYGLMYMHTTFGNWKSSFSPNIPKNSDRSFSNTLTVSWGRYTP